MPLLSGIVVVTDRRQARGALVDVVAAAVRGGARTVLLREKDLPRVRRLALAGRLREVLAEVGGLLIVAGPDPLDGSASHLSATDVLPAIRPGLLGRSCHSEAELAGLTVEDYATLSPIHPTDSKPGYGPALGTAVLERLCAGRTVLALGGVTRPAQVAACRAAGAAGVAVMGAVMSAADPRALVASLLSGWDGLCDAADVAGARVST